MTPGWYVEVVFRNLPSEDEVVLRFGPMSEDKANEFADSVAIGTPYGGRCYFAHARHSGDEGPRA